MSHLEHIQSQFLSEDMPKVIKWGSYEAAQLKFEEHRKKLIHQIMHMEINQGTDFFTELHKKIDQFKNHPVMDRIARSVITGQALEEIHEKYVNENIHEEIKPQEPKQLTVQTPVNELQTEKIETQKPQVQALSEIKEREYFSQNEPKIQEIIPEQQKKSQTSEVTQPTASNASKLDTPEETTVQQISKEIQTIQGSENPTNQTIESTNQENKQPEDLKVEEEKPSKVEDQTKSEEPTTQSKVEQKVEEAQEEKPEAQEVNQKQKQKKQEQKNQNQGQGQGKKKKNKKNNR